MKTLLQDKVAQILEEFVRGAMIKNEAMPLLQARLTNLAATAYQLGVQDGARQNTKRNSG